MVENWEKVGRKDKFQGPKWEIQAHYQVILAIRWGKGMIHSHKPKWTQPPIFRPSLSSHLEPDFHRSAPT